MSDVFVFDEDSAPAVVEDGDASVLVIDDSLGTHLKVNASDDSIIVIDDIATQTVETATSQSFLLIDAETSPAVIAAGTKESILTITSGGPAGATGPAGAVSTTPGPAGPAGPASVTPGPAGPAGADGGSETFNQGVPSSLWQITHSLSFKPSVTVVDSAGHLVEGDVRYLSASAIEIEFAAGFSGTAYLS
jgi:hypothetical protein